MSSSLSANTNNNQPLFGSALLGSVERCSNEFILLAVCPEPKSLELFLDLRDNSQKENHNKDS